MMKTKKIGSVALAALILLPSLTILSACGGKTDVVLRVYNWEEYIDEGGEDSYAYDEVKNPNAPSMIEDFESWYLEKYGETIRVEYSTFGTNEDMYNQLKLGNSYDLVCPSEYMIMKLAAEDMLEPLSDEDYNFYDESNELNYYAKNVSHYIRDVFDSINAVGEKPLSEYAAGYMWGTTGLIYNPETVSEEDLSQGWAIMLDKNYRKKVTTKDNVRDSYFVGLAIAYQEELLELKTRLENGEISSKDFNEEVTKIMNRTDPDSIQKVQDILMEMKENIFGFETDTGKSDMVKGTISMNFAWSGDAVYAMDLAEEQGVELSFYIPEECANLFFDGWCMPKGANKKAARAFINFMSMPENAVRNMDYIGYSSVIAGDEVLDYVEETYGADEGEEDTVSYDLSYFFGKEAKILTYEDQLSRQLFAQYPPEDAIERCAVMYYYGETDATINELWTKVKGETLDAWAIVVICVTVVAVIGVVLLGKFGNKIDFFRLKPKKGYKLVKQEPLSREK